jgi:hypothetical protein
MVEVNSLHTQIRQLIAEMELLSNAPAAKLQSNPGHSKPTSKAPTMDGPALADIWTVRFAQHNDNPLALHRLLLAGRAALELRRHGAPSLHDTIESEDFILTAYEGVDAETVALIESERGALCRPAYVIWLRRRNDRNDRGHPAAPSDSRVAFAKRLEAEGLKQARIAREMGISQSTVSRLLATHRRDRAA